MNKQKPHFLKYLVANATLFDFLFHRLVLIRVHLTYSNLACGLHGGVDVKRGLEASLC
jgi:hypothetical protein